MTATPPPPDVAAAATPAGEYPNPLPRPEGELEKLTAAWEMPKGWRMLSAVNNNAIGVFYIGTAFGFFILAGILALIMRTQLAVPSNTFLDQDTYHPIFRSDEPTYDLQSIMRNTSAVFRLKK